MRPLPVLVLCALPLLLPVQGRAQTASLHDFERADVFYHDGAAARLTPEVAAESDGFAALEVVSAPADADGYAGAVTLARWTHLAPETSPALAFAVRADPHHDLTLGVRLFDDDDGDGVACCDADDVFGRDVALAAGSGWHLVHLPFDTFADLGAAGDGRLDPGAPRAGGDGALVRVAFELRGLPSGEHAAVALDDVLIVPAPDAPPVVLHDFEERGRFPVGEGQAPVALAEVEAPRSESDGTRVLALHVGPAAGAPASGGVGLRRRAHLPRAEGGALTLTVRPDARHTLRLHVSLREDDDGDGAFDPRHDDAFEAWADLPAADGFHSLSLPYDRFVDANAGGDGRFDPVAPRAGGNGELLDVLLTLHDVPDGATAHVLLDDLVLAGAARRVAAVPPTPLPDRAVLAPPAPNPFRVRTMLHVEVPTPQLVRLEAFDALGRRVALLHDGPLAPGRHAVPFAADGLAAGVYTVRLLTPAGTAAQRVVLLR